jgi:hypothetical protein
MHASWRKKKKRKVEGEENPAHKQPNNLLPKRKRRERWKEKKTQPTNSPITSLPSQLGCCHRFLLDQT